MANSPDMLRPRTLRQALSSSSPATGHEGGKVALTGRVGPLWNAFPFTLRQ